MKSTIKEPLKKIHQAALALEQQLEGQRCILCIQGKIAKPLMIVPETPQNNEIGPKGAMRFFGVAICKSCMGHPHHEELAGEIARLRIACTELGKADDVVYVDVPYH